MAAVHGYYKSVIEITECKEFSAFTKQEKLEALNKLVIAVQESKEDILADLKQTEEYLDARLEELQ